jgi:pyruvate ferredoxin oxidoreductase alpha subunit
MEHKAKQNDAMMKSPKVIEEVFAEFEKISGRKYNMVEEYKLEDADVVIVCLGTTFETAQIAVDNMRKKGVKAGIIMPRVFRPTRVELLASMLQNAKAIVCMDRSAPGGQLGILFQDISSSLINTEARPLMSNIIYGLGGRDMTVVELEDIMSNAQDEVNAGKLNGSIQRWVGVRGPELKYYTEGR